MSRPPADAGGLEELHPELRSRVLAATAHAEHRLITGPSAEGEYEVHALIGDRFVHMLLSMHPSGSVNETTETLLRRQILHVAVAGDKGRLEVEDADGRLTIMVPSELARALGEDSVGNGPGGV
jgi:hypothetical protein